MIRGNQLEDREELRGEQRHNWKEKQVQVLQQQDKEKRMGKENMKKKNKHVDSKQRREELRGEQRLNGK